MSVEYRKIINFWKYINNLQPVEAKPVNEKRYKGKLKEAYPIKDGGWGTDPFSAGFAEGYRIACGNIFNSRLYAARKLIDPDEFDTDDDKSFVFELLTDKDGKYEKGSFRVARFLYFLLFANLDSDDLDLNEFSEDLKEFNSNMDASLEDKKLSFSLLENITNMCLRNTGVSADDLKLFVYPRTEDGDNDEIFQMDFYSDDLELISKAAPDDFIARLIEGRRTRLKPYSFEKSFDGRIDDNRIRLSAMIKPANKPYGMWPGKFLPVLMQEFAINAWSSDKTRLPELLSVNGPPGTGKTTILKEIVAESVVRTALTICCSKESDLFYESSTNCSRAGYKKVYGLRRVLTDSFIIVASNNNAAVENISRELPKAKDVKKSRTGLFDTAKGNIYFTDIADDVLGTDMGESWGLISARFGRKDNILQIVDNLFADDKCRLTDYPHAMPFERERREFEALYAEVKDMAGDIHAVSRGNSDMEKEKYFSEDSIIKGDFFDDIVTNEKSQMSSPWNCASFNKLREELFYKALKVIEAFVSNSYASEKIAANLRCYRALMNRDSSVAFPDSAKEWIIRAGVSSLNLVIPVLSTTFASVNRSLGAFKMEQLGTVIVDEAGQAVPFSSMGLLFRSRHRLIVGDPLQVSPVVTVPPHLVETVARFCGLDLDTDDLDYIKQDISLQSVADRMSPYWGKIGNTVVGCPLVVHRRCQNPMFDISNRISYDGRMVQAVKEEEADEEYVLEESGYADVFGPEENARMNRHYIDAQGEYICELIDAAIKRGQKPFSLEHNNLFIITPFRSVEAGIKRKLKSKYGQDNKELSSWLDDNVGTVHRFQGKEADSVIFVTGCTKNSMPAIKWAADNPYILNVALTRAKHRFVMVAVASAWRQACFADAMKLLPRIYSNFEKK